MARYKRLDENVPSKAVRDRFPVPWAEVTAECRKVPVVFGVNGLYFDRLAGKAWVEVEGDAWDADVVWFKSLLADEDARPLSIDERAAISVLMRAGLCPDGLSRLYYQDDSRRRMRIECFRVKRRFRKLLREIEDDGCHD